MGRVKKNRNQDRQLKVIILITAITQLVSSLIALINRLLE